MMRHVLLLLLAASVCLGADTTPEGLRKLVRGCLVNLQGSGEKIKSFTYRMTVEDKELDPHGAARTRSRVVSRSYDGDITVSRLLSRDGVPLSEAERRQNEEQIQKRLAELKARSPEQRAKDAEQRRKGRNSQAEWYKEAPEALDFKLDGQETIDGRASFVVEFSPHPGYRPANIWARVFLKMSGKVWIDAEETELVKADALIFDDVTIGWGLVGRIDKGTGFSMDRTRVAPLTWLPRTEQNHYSARLLLKTIRGDERVEYAEYVRR